MKRERKALSNKNRKNTSRLPGRKFAIACQYIGMLVFFGTLALQLLFAFSKNTLLFYYSVSAVFLGCGVLLRRQYDKD